MNVMGIIFANDTSLGSLTDKRTMASLPYGGRYRQVDFALSNLTCAGVRHVGIFTRHSYQSLMHHIGSGEEWGLELGEGTLEFLTPYSHSATDSYRGKLESLASAMDFLRYGNEDYIAIIDAAVLSNVDLDKVVAAHAASGKDITVVAKAGICNGSKQVDLALKLEKGEIIDMAVDYAAPEGYLASMDFFVVNKKWLIGQVKECVARNLYHMDRNLIMGGWNKGTATVNVYEHDGVALFNETVDEYYRNTLALLDKDVRHDLFGANHPVYTKVRDRVPCYYGEDAQLDDCLVADGCMLEGKVKNSVLFRQVTIGEDAEVEDCIIMNDSVVGKGAKLKYVILDKETTVTPGAKLYGTKEHPIVIKKGETV